MKISIDKINLFLFVILCFITSRAYPLASISFVSYISIIGLIYFTLFHTKLYQSGFTFFIIAILPLAILNLILSIFIEGNEPIPAFRAFFLLIILVLAFFVKLDQKAVKYFIYIMVFHSFVLLGLYIYAKTMYNPNNFVVFRDYIRKNNFGDMYSLNKGLTYFIQIKGNALLVIAILLNTTYVFFDKKKRLIINLILITGLLLAGNLNFIIVLLVYFLLKISIYYSKKITRKRLLAFFFTLILLIFTLPFVINYIIESIDRKNNSDNNTVRVEQFNFLTEDLNESLSSIVLGKGFGNTIKRVGLRVYYDGDYKYFFELQSIYFLNQVGYFLFFLFLGFNIFFCKYRFDKTKSYLYFLYIISGIANPYILDFYHFIVIVLLTALPNNQLIIENE